jgi:hypothetical protein
MANIFTLENIADFSEKLNIDELYEKKRQQDLSKLALFNKILNRIHVKIKTISKHSVNEQFCWFLVPETIIGVPRYDQASCIAYLIDKLKNNGFIVRYIHPNMLFISWVHFIPAYVRSEFKKKTGILVDEFGKKIEDETEPDADSNDNILQDPNNYLTNTTNQDNKNKNKQLKKEYTPINSYKPSGNLVYDDELLNKIGNRFT